MTRSGTVKLIVAIAVFGIVGVGVYARYRREEEAGLANLPEGVIAEAGGMQFVQSDIDEYLDSLPESLQEVKAKDPEGVLKEVVEKWLLLQEAEKLPKEYLRDTSEELPEDAERMLLSALRDYMTRDAMVPEERVRAYYDEHRSEYEGREGGSYDEMHDSIKEYLRWPLVEKAFKERKKAVTAGADMKIDRGWISKVRSQVKDPLAEARSSGKVTAADFGRGI